MPAMFSLIVMRNQLKSVATKKNRPTRKIDQELVDSPGSPKVMSFMMLAAPKMLSIRPMVAQTASLLLSGT